MLRQRRVSVVARRGKFVGGSMSERGLGDPAAGRALLMEIAPALAVGTVIDGEGVTKRSSGRKTTSLAYFVTGCRGLLVSYKPLALVRGTLQKSLQKHHLGSRKSVQRSKPNAPRLWCCCGDT